MRQLFQQGVVIKEWKGPNLKKKLNNSSIIVDQAIDTDGMLHILLKMLIYNKFMIWRLLVIYFSQLLIKLSKFGI